MKKRIIFILLNLLIFTNLKPQLAKQKINNQKKKTTKAKKLTSSNKVNSKSNKKTTRIRKIKRPRQKKDILVKRRRPRKRKSTFSVGDIPKTKEEKRILKTAIGTKKEPPKETLKDLEKKQIRVKDPSDPSIFQYLEPWRDIDLDEKIELNFENKELTEFLKFLEDNLKIKFILDDYVGPKRAEGLKPLAGTKVSFKSITPLNLKQVWQLAMTFLEMSGFSVEPTTLNRTYHVTASAAKDKPSANSGPLPVFINANPDLLPKSDIKIRYVYFVENAELETLTNVVDKLRSGSSAAPIKLPEIRAIIMTDRSNNIRSLLKIIEEVDKASTPEMLAIIKLKHADATEVRKLYHALIGKEEDRPYFPFRQKKPPTVHYFTEATRVFDEPRTNSLVILGTQANIKKFEEFISQYIDKKSTLPYAPLFIYPLKFLEADAIARLLNEIIGDFSNAESNRVVSSVGGVRDGNKYLKSTTKITPETSGNRLIINADYEDYLKIREILEKLDAEQPQVAIKVLVLDVDISNTKEFGTQLRNSVACTDGSGGTDSILGRNVNFQFAGLNGFITRNQTSSGQSVCGAERLLGNLIKLADFQPNIMTGLFGQGTTLVTLGKDIFGFWGLLRILERITRVSVVANPFLITSHKYKAEFSVGETRRVLTAIVNTAAGSTNSQGNLSANLKVEIIPQISYDDMITLEIYTEITDFAEAEELGPTRISKKLKTEAILANKEVIALGGLIRDRASETEFKIPILGDLPLIGWIFKDKRKIIERTSLLILIAPEIIKPYEPEIANKFTNSKLNDAKETLYSMESKAEQRDPIHRWIFQDHKEKEVRKIDKFISQQGRYVTPTKKIKPVLAINNDNKNSSNKKSLLEFVDKKNTKKERVT